MRRIVNSTFVSLDGIINHMETWHFNYVDEESNQIAAEQLDASDALLMGRKTYEVYASAWPGRDDEYSRKMNSIRKYVASTTMDRAGWNNTTVISGDLVQEVTTLKQQPGGDILMHGYGPVARTLLKHGLLDELHLWVHPVLAGVGATEDMLFDKGQHAVLDLRDAKRLGSGVVILSYQAQSSG